jgi:hypothetical protein
MLAVSSRCLRWSRAASQARSGSNGPPGNDVAIINAREPHHLAAANCERVRKVTPTPEQAAADFEA